MEKIIFFGLAIPILAFVLYLGGTAIMKGFEAKRENKSNVEEGSKGGNAQLYSSLPHQSDWKPVVTNTN